MSRNVLKSSDESDLKWARVTKDLSEEQKRQARVLREDYITACRDYVPLYPGRALCEVIAELVRMGWHKELEPDDDDMEGLY